MKATMTISIPVSVILLAARFDARLAAAAAAPPATAFAFVGRSTGCGRRQQQYPTSESARPAASARTRTWTERDVRGLYSSAALTAVEAGQEASTDDEGSAAPSSASPPPPPPVPDKSTLLADLNRLSRRAGSDEPGLDGAAATAAAAAQSLLDSAESWYQDRIDEGQTVVNAEVERVDEMDNVVIGPIPGVACYLSVIEAWCALSSSSAGGGGGGGVDSVRRAEAILGRMYELSERAKGAGTARKIKPNKGAYQTVIAAYADVGEREAAERAEALLEEMIAKSMGRGSGGEATMASPANLLCRPDVIVFNLVMKAWSNAGGNGAGRRAEALLDRLWSLHESTGGSEDDSNFKPNLVSYTTAITAWARSGEGGRGARMGERLLEKMEELNRGGETSLKPTSFCVNAVLNAWAKSNKRGSAERAELILKRMEDLYLGGRTELKPTAISYNTAISAYARSGGRGSERRAELLLRRMDALSSNETTMEDFAECAPDIISFNTVINAWAKSSEKNAARRAEAILRHMDRQYAARGGSKRPFAVAPDVTSYTSVVNAWARSGEAVAAERADAIVKRMEEISLDGTNPGARPNTLTYNSLLNVLAKSDDPRAADGALEILDRMEKGYAEGGRVEVAAAKPDVYTYTSVIDALARCESLDAAEKAAALLEKIEEQYKKTSDVNVRPNVRTYTSVINGYARSKRVPEKAEAILERMESLYERGHNSEAKPDVVCFNAVLNAWAWSSDPRKAFRARNVFRRMMGLYESGENVDARPDIISVNSLLKACAFTRAGDVPSEADRAEIIDVCVRTLEVVQARLPEFGRPNMTTFATMLLAITNHLPPCDLRTELAQAAFLQCCKAGQVSGLVVSSFLKAVGTSSEAMALGILGDALLDDRDEEGRRKFDIRRLPGEWTRNSAGRKSRPSRRRFPREVTNGQRLS